jgi:hypothetical protein
MMITSIINTKYVILGTMIGSIDEVASIQGFKPGSVLHMDDVGQMFDGPALVSEESRPSTGKIVLLKRYAFDTLYRAELSPSEISMSGIGISFDYWKGQRIQWGSGNGEYARYQKELERAGL